MIILGIDPGITRKNPCGAALLDWNDGAPRLLWSAALFDAANPLAHIVTALDRLDWPLDGVAVEVPHMIRNPQTVARLAEVVGVALSLAVRRNVPALRVQPAQAKQALTGFHQAEKPAMIAAARAQFGLDLSKDAADAVGVAVYGASQFARFARLAAAD